MEKKPKIHDPSIHVVDIGKRYPHAWKMIDFFRENRGKDGLPDWPEWCFFPVAGSYMIVTAGKDEDELLKNVGDIGSDIAVLSILAAWRVTKGIYRFDQTVFESLKNTPNSGILPTDVLFCIPEWCVYIDTPGYKWTGNNMNGFFANLEWDEEKNRSELRLVLDLYTVEDVEIKRELLPIVIHLDACTLEEGFRSAISEAIQCATEAGVIHAAEIMEEYLKIKLELEPLISLLLYLCSMNAEIGDGKRNPTKPKPKKTKSGYRLFQADKPMVWDVGVRLGSAIRRGYTSQSEHQGGTHARPRPHIRRAHWHTFLAGHGRKERRLKWLPPIPVNVDDVEDLPATVRPVR